MPTTKTMPALSRRAQVASALMFAGATVSGEALARDLGISRVAVSNHVAALRSLGYRIESAPRAGYRLIDAPDLCIPEEVGPRLRHDLWASCEGGVEVASTSDLAKGLARTGVTEGALVVASRQTAGRGRFDRAWESPRGGIYASAVLRPPAEPSAVASLSLVVALGAARALAAVGVPARVKWPNDLEAEGRKLGGVLLEMAAEADRVEWLVAGVGINVADPGRQDSAWVRQHAPGCRVAEVAARVLDSVAAAYREWVGGGFAPMRAEYESILTILRQGVAVRSATGSIVAEGLVKGVDATGALLVDTREGVVAVNAGEVTLRG